MPDAVYLVKKAAVEAVSASKPVEVQIGTVRSIAPLVIEVEQRLPLRAKHLILSRHVTDHVVTVTLSHTTETALEEAGLAHAHAYEGTKQVTVHGGLQVGEVVLLLRVQGGNKYVVWDRLGGPA